MRRASIPFSRGFSFIELLFAVAVMGIGFIMVAAIFPVGLQQTKLTLDETAAAASARGAAAALQQVAQNRILAVAGSPPITPTNSTSIMPASSAAVPGAPQVPANTARLVPGQVRSFRDSRAFSDANGNTKIHDDTIWRIVSGNIIDKSDPRNAAVVLYKRDWQSSNYPATGLVSTPAGSAQIIVINAQVANQSAYTAADVYRAGGQALYNLQPRPVGVTIEINTDGESIIDFSPISNANGNAQGFAPADIAAAAQAPNAVAEGTFVVISDDQIKTPDLDKGRMNGRVYRVGVRRTDIGPNAWQLAPGYEFTADPGFGGQFNDLPNDDITKIGIKTTGGGSTVDVNGPAVAFIVGRGFADPAVVPAAAGGFTGVTQDVSVYTTFVSVP